MNAWVTMCWDSCRISNLLSESYCRGLSCHCLLGSACGTLLRTAHSTSGRPRDRLSLLLRTIVVFSKHTLQRNWCLFVHLMLVLMLYHLRITIDTNQVFGMMICWGHQSKFLHLSDYVPASDRCSRELNLSRAWLIL